MPGTGPDDGVGPVEITPRSVMGVKEPKLAGNPSTDTPGSVVPSANVVMELFAGVVNGLLVRRSSLWKQSTPTALPTRNCSSAGQPGAASAASGHGITASAAHSRIKRFAAIVKPP